MVDRKAYEEAIKDFQDYGKQIDSVVDLILRGTGASKKMKPEWSDLDFSIILKKITPQATAMIQRLHSLLQEKYPFKISIVVVTQSDFELPIHYHGDKPAFYTNHVKKDLSLLGYQWQQNTSSLSQEIFRRDCFQNISYLIHDLRKVIFQKLGSLSSRDVRHFAKRSQHLIKNSLYFLEGSEIDFTNISFLLPKYFGKEGQVLWDTCVETKENWLKISQDPKLMNEIGEKIYFMSERIYELFIKLQEK